MALTDKLSAIGDAIREKGGTSAKLTLDEMPVAIGAIETGGGGGDLPEEAFLITGDCTYRFAHNGWNWFVENYGNKITTKDITNASNMFHGANTLEEIPFAFNFKQSSSPVILSYLFNGATKLKAPPILGPVKINNTGNMFNGCNHIKIPEDYGSDIDWSYAESRTSGYQFNQSNMFNGCSSLRKIPVNLIKSGNSYESYGYSIYMNGFSNCYTLDEIVNLPIPYTKATWTSNAFIGTFNYCSRLKNLTFATNEDGTPIVVKWKSQTIDLTSYVGYISSALLITDYNSGITADKEVKSVYDYETLKDDEDWFTTLYQYSRYDGLSARATLASLPDTSAYLASAGGTNTIKFKQSAGGGKLKNNVPLEIGTFVNATEIANAAAKGWTVAFV